jgi:hypothetical protein
MKSNMKNSWFKTVFGAALMLSAASAMAADEWSSYFVIDYLDNESSGSAGDSYAVKRDSGSHANPAGCANATYAYPSASASDASRELMARILLGAYLAGKPVRLRISGSTCTQSGPTYYAVAVDNDS